MGKRQKIAALPDDTLKENMNMTGSIKPDATKDAPDKESESVAPEQVRLQKSMGLPSACAAIVGTIIGSGIFVSPKGILQEVHSVGLSLVIWLGAGILCSIGGLTYTELGTMMPESGGAYVYIKRSFGDCCAFMYMWAISVIVIPAHDAVIALTFAQYMVQPFFPDCDAAPGSVITILAMLAIGK